MVKSKYFNMYLNYFAYDISIDDERLLRYGINIESKEKVSLKDYKIVFNKKSKINPKVAIANIEKSEGSYVEGVLYKIDVDSIIKLNSLQGFPRHYTKINIVVDDKEAFTYVANDDYIDEKLTPSKDYINNLLNVKNVFSNGYSKELKKIKTIC